MNARLGRVEEQVAHLSRSVGHVDGKIDALMHMGEEGTQARHDLAATLERHMAIVSQHMQKVDQALADGKDKIDSVAPMAEIAKTVRGILIKALSVGLIGLVVLVLLFMAFGAKFLINAVPLIGG